MIKKITISNYKLFRTFTVDCDASLNVIVGANESGKSTLLEAINLALTRRLNGRPIDTELTPYLFNNDVVAEYVNAVRQGDRPQLPKIVIELQLTADERSAIHRGTNNLDDVDAPGIHFEIAFDEEYTAEYEELLREPANISGLPTEYYRSHWYSFAQESLTLRSVGVRASFIDATTIRLQTGTDQYLHNIINDGLDPKQRAGLAMAYRRLKEKFSEEAAIGGINSKLTEQQGTITDKSLALGIDLTQRGSWETSLVPHLDDVPFQHIGKGDQHALKIMLALDRDSESHVVMIEEPENHLSFGAMNVLLSRVARKCEGKQIFAATHSAFVLNKLGLGKLMFVRDGSAMFLRELSTDTQNYFRRLPGYDTLRMILARKCILVEGPSDELVVQKAYLLRHGKLPIDDGIDVLSVRGLSFTRFLDIAKRLRIPTIVVTDNDGDHERRVTVKYSPYVCETIRVCADADNACPTLENQFLRANSRASLNAMLGTTHVDDPSLLSYMKDHKADWALKVFETDSAVQFPEYINDAVR